MHVKHKYYTAASYSKSPASNDAGDLSYSTNYQWITYSSRSGGMSRRGILRMLRLPFRWKH
jgi:hypothetical protein